MESPAGQLLGETLGDVRIEELIGVGGMAEVYRGRDLALGRDVAVKVLSPALHAEARNIESFREEARRVAALDNPHIVPIYQFGEAHGSLYLVMPLLKESLRERLQREPVIPAATAIKITVQIASALDAAHRQGLVHHDVKPENILLNADGKAFLTDFGIASQMATTLAAQPEQNSGSDPQITPAIRIGTPSYMAPEQWMGGTLDQLTDIYSLGIVLYEMLTVVTPDDALQRSLEQMRKQQETPASIEPPSTYNTKIWPELDNALMVALAYAASDRYPDMRSFALALRGALLRHQLDTQGRANDTSRGVQLSIPLYWLQSADTSFESDSETTLPLAANEGVSSSVALPLPAPITPFPPAKKTTQPHSKALIGTLLALALLSLALSSVALFASHHNAAIASFLGGAATPPATNTAPGITVTAGINSTGATSTASTPASTSPAGAPGATPTANPSATASPSATAFPSATATPPLPQLQVGAVSLSQQHGHNCTGSEAITNVGSTAVSWSWQGFNNLPGDFTYTINAGGSQNGLPHDASLAPNATDTISIVQMSCWSGNTYQGSVLAQDVNDTSQSTSYPLSFTAP